MPRNNPSVTPLSEKTANKGEWAELYVVLKLLGEGKLYAADEHIRKKPDSYVEVLKIIREEIAGMVTEYAANPDSASIEVLVAGEVVATAPASAFLEKARAFFSYLNTVRTSRDEGVRAPKDICDFADTIKITKPKAPSLQTIGNYGGKTDIVINMRDGRNAMVSTMGFSIKSHFAQAPTLYNAGTSTQFLYEMAGMTDKSMAEFNNFVNSGKRDWTSASSMYKQSGINAVFIETANPVTSSNLFYVRESMTDLMAWIYKRSLLEEYRSCDDFVSLTASLVEENPLNYPDTNLYEKVIKDFLFASFAGMTGATPWDGREQINGGYIVVQPDGEVLCYHANDREEFREYLFRQTHIEYVSCKKYKWGYAYKNKDGKYILPLNGSVRFFKKLRTTEE